MTGTPTRHYLDHAASTPLVPAAVAAMEAELGRVGNPSSLHSSGRAARARLEQAREQLAQAVGAHPTEVVFTSGGTEADNIALRGGWLARRAQRPMVLASAAEHPAITETLAALAGDGAQARTLPVDQQGLVDLDGIDWPRVAVASVMWVNNETGVVNDPTRLVAAASGSGAWTHADAVQALGHLPVRFADSGLDLASLSAHKVGGPVGIGALLVRREVTPHAIGFGGGQERDIRSGTLAVALAAGFAAATEAAVAARAAEASRLAELTRRLSAGLAELPGTRRNPDAGPTSPALVNVSFAGVRADDLLLLLDAAGVDCSTGSACSAGVSQPSPVLVAMGRSLAEASSALRFSLGHSSTTADVEALLTALPEALMRARAAF